MRNRALVFLALSALSPRASMDATAATITVTSTADNGAGSFRQAVQSAASGDTIDFYVTGVITLTNGELLVTNNLTIVGPGASSLALSGNTNSRIFEIGTNVHASISGLSLRDGHAADGKVSGASGENGGGIYNLGTLTLTACTVSGNASGNGYSTIGGVAGAGGWGGGIYNVGSLVLTACSVTGNIAGKGGYTGISWGGGGGRGGGICNFGTLALTACTLSGNDAGTGGAGGSTGFGGGFRGLPGADGGGGGAIYNVGTLTLTNCTLSGNGTGAGGAGGYGRRGGGPGGNGGSGGAIYSGGILTLIACTISGNGCGAGGTGGTTGGGIVGGAGGNGGTGGGICSAAGTSSARLLDTLVAGNYPGAAGAGGLGHPNGLPGSPGSGPDVLGSFTSQGYNLIGQANGSTGFTNGVNADIAGSTNSPVNALLGPLQNNGGPTLTLALLTGSPALNVGDDALLIPPLSITTDQRGLPRKSGSHVDIGSYELQVANSILPALVAKGQFHMTLVGHPGISYTVQATTDFLSWTTLTNLASPTGTNEFTDPSAGSFPQRFYRTFTQ